MKLVKVVGVVAASVAIIATAFIQIPRVFSQSNEDLLLIAREGTKNTAAMIKSGSGKVTQHLWTKNKNGGISEAEIVYTLMFSGNKFRLLADESIIQNNPGSGEDGKLLLSPGSKIHFQAAYDGDSMTIYYPDEEAANIIKSNATDKPIRYWQDIGLPAFEFRELSPAEGSAVAKRESVNGISYIIVDWSNTTSSTKYGNITNTWTGWLDPEKGFTVSKFQVYGKAETVHKDPVLLEDARIDVRDYGSGLWGPVKYTKVSYRPDKDGEMQKVREATVTYEPDFHVNIPLSDDQLSLNLPSGTKVVDELLDAKYTVQ